MKMAMKNCDESVDGLIDLPEVAHGYALEARVKRAARNGGADMRRNPQEAPEVPHTETLIFATGRGVALTSRVPLDDMCDIAVRVLRDDVVMTPETGVGLCNALLDLEAQLQTARLQLAKERDATQAYVLDLKATREAVLQAEMLRRAALDEALQQRALAIKLSEENRVLRLESSAYLDLQVCVGRDPLDDEHPDLGQVGDQWNPDDEHPDLGQVGDQWNPDDCDTIVQDTPYGKVMQ
jgi:hypothetical protein